MNKLSSHRWFHALVVTGASLTACGGQTEDDPGDASGDTAPIDGSSIDVASPGSDAGPPIIIITPDAGASPEDVRNDPRCCTITK